MACNECNKPCLDNQTSKCPPCPIKLGTVCVFYDGEPLGNLDVVAGENMQEILIKINDLIVSSNLHSNLGDGARVFKQVNLLNQVELRTIDSVNELISVVEGTEKITLEFKSPVNLGDGAEVFKEVNPSGEIAHRTLTSSDGSMEIIQGSNTIDFSVVSEVSELPRYIVNNLYTGDEELGTVGKPYKTIQNAIDAFVGNGDKDDPDNPNAAIIIQKGNTYTFTGNFTYRNLNVIVEEGAVINHTPPTGGYLIDYDELTDIKSTGSLIVKDGAVLNLSQKGVRNKGSLGGASQAKLLKISGEGEIKLNGSRQSGYALVEANYSNDSGYGMPTLQNFTFDGISLTSVEKDFWNVGRDAEIIFNNCKIRHSYKSNSIDIASESFSQKGGSITTNNCEFYICGGERTNCFTLEKDPSFGCSLTIEGGKLVFPDIIANFFFRYGTGNPTVVCQNFSTTDGINLSYIFNVDTGIWTTGAFLRYTVFTGGKITLDSGGGLFVVDLTNGNTVSTSNLIGGRNVQTLSKYPTRSAAALALSSGSLFINTNSDNLDGTTWFLDIVI